MLLGIAWKCLTAHIAFDAAIARLAAGRWRLRAFPTPAAITDSYHPAENRRCTCLRFFILLSSSLGGVPTTLWILLIWSTSLLPAGERDICVVDTGHWQPA